MTKLSSSRKEDWSNIVATLGSWYGRDRNCATIVEKLVKDSAIRAVVKLVVVPSLHMPDHEKGILEAHMAA